MNWLRSIISRNGASVVYFLVATHLGVIGFSFIILIQEDCRHTVTTTQNSSVSEYPATWGFLILVFVTVLSLFCFIFFFLCPRIYGFMCTNVCSLGCSSHSWALYFGCFIFCSFLFNFFGACYLDYFTVSASNMWVNTTEGIEHISNIQCECRLQNVPSDLVNWVPLEDIYYHHSSSSDHLDSCVCPNHSRWGVTLIEAPNPSFSLEDNDESSSCTNCFSLLCSFVGEAFYKLWGDS